MNIELTYAAFALAALAVFRFLPAAVAVLVVFLGGWIVLPVGVFPPGSSAVDFPYWITGLAVPSDMLFTKAWAAPAAALLGVLVFDRAALMRLRPVWADLPLALWCLWPLLQSAGAAQPQPAGWVASLYLVGSWGLPWLLGRLYFATPDGLLLLVKGLVFAGVACLPFSLIESVFGPVTYAWLYELHPFRLDGATRYIGYRPIGFFEHGNQFGLWVSLCALAAVWLAWTTPPAHRHAPLYRGLAVLVVAMAVAAQSVGGILILALGVALLWVSRWVRPRLMLAGASAVLILSGAVYVSGVVPITRLAKDTAMGQRAVGVFKSIGRSSFTWRIAQDQRLMGEAMKKPITGSANWAWWRDKDMRPWGLTVLVIGQYGLIGLAACLATLLWPAIAAAWRSPRGSPWRMDALPFVLAMILGLTVFDALMNSFIFFPALLAAGALASSSAALRPATGSRPASVPAPS
jgi:hypothetical protein